MKACHFSTQLQWRSATASLMPGKISSDSLVNYVCIVSFPTLKNSSNQSPFRTHSQMTKSSQKTPKMQYSVLHITYTKFKNI